MLCGIDRLVTAIRVSLNMFTFENTTVIAADVRIEQHNEKRVTHVQNALSKKYYAGLDMNLQFFRQKVQLLDLSKKTLHSTYQNCMGKN